jgi:hypothetical protein
VHAPQSALESHGSVGVAAHALETQRQSLHAPPVGPVELPVWHVELPAHQPHAERAVQSLHAPLLLQGSPLAAQSLRYQRQSVQLPEIGPLELPCWHPPPLPHQPQLAREVHAPQSAASVQGSVAAD